jgi:hypothetical protein
MIANDSDDPWNCRNLDDNRETVELPKEDGLERRLGLRQATDPCSVSNAAGSDERKG